MCVNNGGGGIFDFLPVAEHADRALLRGARGHAERHGPAAVAALAGMEHRLAATPDEVQDAVRAPGLVEVRTERAENVRLHRELVERVALALATG